MKNRLLIALSLILVVSVLQLAGSVSPVTVTGIDGSDMNRSGKKPLARRSVTPSKFISPEARMQQLKQAASGGSALQNISSQNSVVTLHNDEAFKGGNSLRAQKNSASRVGAGNNAQPAAVSNVKAKAALFGNKRSGQVSQSYDAASVPVQEGHVNSLRARYENNASAASNNNVSRRSSVVVNKNVQMNQAAPAEQARSVDASDVNFANIYAPEVMNNNMVHYEARPENNDFNMSKLYDSATINYSRQVSGYADNPAKQSVEPAKLSQVEVNFGDIYNPSVVEHANNSMHVQAKPVEVGVDYADAYAHNEGLGSALGEFTSHNPAKQNKVTDLVVYDPTQKYQKPIEVSASRQVQAPKSQGLGGKFAGVTSLALNNYRNNLQQNQQNNVERSNFSTTQPAEDVELFDWAKDVKLPASAKSVNSGSNINQTEPMLNSRARMLEGYHAQTAKQAQMKQFEATQKVLQSKKPAYKASIL